MLSDNDKQRIEQGNPYASFPDVANVYREGYEAATLYERQQQAKTQEENEMLKTMVKDKYKYMTEPLKFEAERSELIEKMTELLKAFNDSDKNYADWVATKELYAAFTGVNNLLERLNSLKK